MNAEDIEMGEWYRCSTQQRGEEFTPLTLYCDQHTEMAFRRRSDGWTYLFSVSDMEPVPEPVVFMEQWIVMGKQGFIDFYNSLEAAEAATHRHRADSRYRSAVIGILHVRTDGSTEMLEIKS